MAENKLKKENKPSWRHYNFVTAGPVDDYLYSLLPKRDEVLAEMEGYASEHNIPIVGPAVARVLQQLALMINAKTVFELGSAIGYSTIWWARAVGKKAASFIRTAIRRMPSGPAVTLIGPASPSRITLHTGDALELLPSRSSNSTSSSTMSIKKIIRACCGWFRRGCAKAACSLPIMFLWSGRVAEKNPKDATTKAILEFNRLLYNSEDFFTTILPIRDGLAVAVKK